MNAERNEPKANSECIKPSSPDIQDVKLYYPDDPRFPIIFYDNWRYERYGPSEDLHIWHTLFMLDLLCPTNMISHEDNFAGICELFDICMNVYLMQQELNVRILNSVQGVFESAIARSAVNVLGYATEIGLLRRLINLERVQGQNYIDLSGFTYGFVLISLSDIDLITHGQHKHKGLISVASTIFIMIDAGIKTVDDYELCKLQTHDGDKAIKVMQCYNQVYTDTKTTIFYMLGMYKRSRMLRDHRDTLQIIAKLLHRRRIVTCVDNIPGISAT